jgi:hypothetical protein
VAAGLLFPGTSLLRVGERRSASGGGDHAVFTWNTTGYCIPAVEFSTMFRGGISAGLTY